MDGKREHLKKNKLSIPPTNHNQISDAAGGGALREKIRGLDEDEIPVPKIRGTKI